MASFRILAVLVTLGAGLFSSGCGRQAASTGDSSQVLRISQRNEPGDLDPATAGLPDDFFIIRALSEGLLIPAPGVGPPLPGTAERYSVSADGLIYTFHLRNDARWSNGDPVTSLDFIASFERVLTPGTAAPKTDLFHAVKQARAFAAGEIDDFTAVGFAAPDSRTLVVTLELPTPRFLHYVASGPWIPTHAHTIAQHGRRWTEPGNFVGNGPFLLVEWRAQQRIVVKKNPGYHGANGVRIHEIHFLRFDSGDTEERAFRTGQVDITMSVPATKLTGYERGRPAEFHRSPLAETRYLSFNTMRPALRDPQVRRALALAIDRPRLVEFVLMGGQTPAGRLLPPPLRSATDVTPLAAEFQHDPARARRQLAEAGFPEGRGFPRLEVTTWSPSQLPVLEAIQEMWRQSLGIEVTLSLREAKVHVASLQAGDYDIGFATTLLDVPDSLALFAGFTSQAPDNLPRWSHAGFDRHVSQARSRIDQLSQERDLLAAEALLLEEVPLTPVYFNARNWLMSPRVRGWREDALWTRFYTGVYLE